MLCVYIEKQLRAIILKDMYVYTYINLKIYEWNPLYINSGTLQHVFVATCHHENDSNNC